MNAAPKRHARLDFHEWLRRAEQRERELRRPLRVEEHLALFSEMEASS